MVLELIPNREQACLLDTHDQMLGSLPPTSSYERPASKAAAPLDSLKHESFLRLFQKSSDVSALARGLGLSPVFARELVHRAAGNPETAWQALQSLLEQIDSGPHSPRIYHPSLQRAGDTPGLVRKTKGIFSPIPLQYLGATQYESFASMNDLCGALLERYLQRDVRQIETRSKLDRIAGALKKKMRLHENLLADLRKNEKAEVFKTYADLLYAQQDKSPKGLTVLRVINLFHSNLEELDIPLDATLSLIQNANRYSRIYQKANRALPQVRERLRKLNAELESLQAEQQKLTVAVSSASLHVAAVSQNEAAGGQSGALRTRQHPSADKSEAVSERRKEEGSQAIERKTAKIFISSEGFQILVGKTSRDNDTLTLKIARSDDFWLHVAGYGGSHVVLRNPDRLAAAPKQSLLEAAQLAAYFSQARNAPKVEVHYTQKKFVSKPKGTKPGLVRLKEHKSIAVKPKLLETPKSAK